MIIRRGIVKELGRSFFLFYYKVKELKAGRIIKNSNIAKMTRIII